MRALYFLSSIPAISEPIPLSARSGKAAPACGKLVTEGSAVRRFDTGTALAVEAGLGCVPGSGVCVAACGGFDDSELLFCDPELRGLADDSELLVAEPVPLISLLLAPFALELGLLAPLLFVAVPPLGVVDEFGCWSGVVDVFGVVEVLGVVPLWFPLVLWSAVAGVLPVVPMVEEDPAPLWLDGCWSLTAPLGGAVLGVVLSGLPELRAPPSRCWLGTGIVDDVPFCTVPGAVFTLPLSAPFAELCASAIPPLRTAIAVMQASLFMVCPFSSRSLSPSGSET